MSEVSGNRRVGIVSYGAFIPKLRLSVEEVARVWGNLYPEFIKEELMVSERAVLGADEDTNTLALAAAEEALNRIDVSRESIGALYLGTCTNPYSTRPSATFLADSLGLPGQIFCADVQFAGKSGTSALQMAVALVKAGMVDLALVIASDTMNRHAAPGTVYEYSASAAAVALLIGHEDVAVTIDATTSYATDLSDYFRLDGERYIRPGGLSAMETEIGFPKHVREAIMALLRATGLSVGDFDHVVFHQHYGIVPLALCQFLEVDLSKITQSVLAYDIGDCGAASSLLALARVLDVCSGGERILLASYGSGAGSDAFTLTVGESLASLKGRGRSVEDLLNDKIQVDYATAMKFERKYIKVPQPYTPWM